MIDQKFKKGSRVRVVQLVAFGSERGLGAILDIFGFEKTKEIATGFKQGLIDAGVSIGIEGTILILYADGFVEVQFEGINYPLDIPDRCLEVI